MLYTAFMREQSCSGCMSATQKNCWESCPMWRTKTGGASVLWMEDKETEMVDRRRMVAELAKRVLGADDLAEQYICSFEQDAPTCNVSDIYFSLLHKDLNAWEKLF